MAIAPHLEWLSLEGGKMWWEGSDMSRLPEMLRAAKRAPKLRELRVEYAGGGWGLFDGLSHFSKV